MGLVSNNFVNNVPRELTTQQTNNKKFQHTY